MSGNDLRDEAGSVNEPQKFDPARSDEGVRASFGEASMTPGDDERDDGARDDREYNEREYDHRECTDDLEHDDREYAREYDREYDDRDSGEPESDDECSEEKQVVAPGPMDRRISVIPGSGLSTKTIQAAGIFWSPDAVNRALLGWPENRPGNAAGIVIPYLTIPGYAKVRFDEPPALPGQPTKPVRGGWHGEDWSQPQVRRQKYGSPAGEPPHVYIPPRELCPDLNNPEKLLIITEGEKKALLLAQEGYPAIALAGVFNWHDSAGRKAGWDNGKDERALHPELAAFLFTRRRVGLCFDAPDMDGSNPQVIREAVLLAKALDAAGHEVVIIYVPHAHGEKTGIDDYLVKQKDNGRSDVIRQLLRDGVPARPSAALDEFLGRRNAGALGPLDGARLLGWAGEWIGAGAALRAFARSLATRKLVTAVEVERFLEVVETNRDRSRPTEFPALCEIFRDDKKRLIACGRRGVLEMDARTQEVFIDRVPFGSDTDISAVRERISRNLRPRGFKGRFDFRQPEICDALTSVAAEHQFNPVQEYLNGLAWDGRPRIKLIQDLVLRLRRGPHTELNDILLRRWFISAVARALDPGCKVDTVLIFQGGQGVKKSTFFSTLAEPWFSDSPVDINNKDGMLALGKCWIIEWPELESMSRARDQTTVKAFISSKRDIFRPPYGRALVEVPRSSIFVGTTNEDDFLTDETGNRRYWIIGGFDQVFALDLLRSWRDQLWAEAVAAFRSEEKWWLTPEEELLLESRHSDYERSDPWEEKIREFVAVKNEVTISAILTEHLRLSLEFQNRNAEMRVADCLKRIGFERGPRVKGVRTWVRKPGSNNTNTK